ncbi:ribosomal maturation YjgA family protein [Salinimicrobium sp. CAU 1759]
MLVFNFKYFLTALLLLFTLVLIAVFVSDSFIRPYGGDFLVIIFLYCLLQSFFKIPVKNAIFGVLLFSFLIEGLQYFRFIYLLDLQDNVIASAVLGSHFEWLDMLVYSLGALTVIIVEKLRSRLSAEK